MAGLRRASYTAPALRRHPIPQGRPASFAVLAVVAIAVGGCSTIMRPLSGWTSSQSASPPDEITTGSIPKPTVAAPPPESDGEVIRRTVETAARGTVPAPARIEWANPASGNSGTLTALIEAKAANGAACRDFATTLATIEGVRMYRGRACQGYAGPWDLVDFGPVEGNPAG